MGDSDTVTMNIPDTNPLFGWLARLNATEPLEYVKLSVGEISARLQLVEIPAIRTEWDDGAFPPRSISWLETSWRLLRDNT